MFLNVFSGGYILPNSQHHARFVVRKNGNHFHVAMDSRYDSVHVHVDGYITSDLLNDSIFRSMADVSEFFDAGSLGYSPQASNDHFDGLEPQAPSIGMLNLWR